VPFDIHRFVLGELRTDRDLLYREVHYLAYHYHWSEQEIMAMTRDKRQRFRPSASQRVCSLWSQACTLFFLERGKRRQHPAVKPAWYAPGSARTTVLSVRMPEEKRMLLTLSKGYFTIPWKRLVYILAP